MMLDLCRLCLVCLNGLWLHGKDGGGPIDDVYMLYGSGRQVCDGGQDVADGQSGHGLKDGNKGGMKGISRLKEGASGGWGAL